MICPTLPRLKKPPLGRPTVTHSPNQKALIDILETHRGERPVSRSCRFSPFSFVGLKFSAALLLSSAKGGLFLLLEVVDPCPEHAPHYFSPADLKTAGHGVQVVEQLIVDGQAQPMGKLSHLGPFSRLTHF